MVASTETNVIQNVLVVSYQSGELVDNCFVLALSHTLFDIILRTNLKPG